MRTILVLNPKGGCGKTTVATNLAACYAVRGRQVVLVDLDPQGSSIDWLAARPEDAPPIVGVAAFAERLRLPRRADVVILDAPAGGHGKDLADLVRRAQTAVVPVLPSPIDLRAADRFTEELFALRRVLNHQIRIGTVINRAREKSAGRLELEEYLRHLRFPDGRRLPFVAVLRASQHYLTAAEYGLGICELAPSTVKHDLALWRPLLRWLGSRASVPGP
jgi:chromosome partitioning protein